MTVRLSEPEAKAVTEFGDRCHMIPSVAIRVLLALGLGRLKPERFQGSEQSQ